MNMESTATIRALRQERGWTQFALALAVGVHPQAVYLCERGRRTPQVPQLRKLGALFGRCSDEVVLVEAAGATAAGRPHRPRRARAVPPPASPGDT